MPAVGRVRRYRAGGIVALIGIIREHRGPVGGDLARAHWTWDDVGAGLPFDQFTQMVVYAPPGSAVYYATHQGWTRDTYKLAGIEDGVNWLVWSKSTAAEDNPNSPPAPQWRPGDPIPEQKQVGTIRDYMRLVGMEGADDD